MAWPAEYATSHYLKQWWPSLLTHICGTRCGWVNTLTIRSVPFKVGLAIDTFYRFHKINWLQMWSNPMHNKLRLWHHVNIVSVPILICTGEWRLDRLSAWRRHQMETFSALLAICAGNSPVTGEFPAQRPATRSFDAFFHLRLFKRLSKQSWGWWFGAPSRPLWCHCNKSWIFTVTRLSKN